MKTVLGLFAIWLILCSARAADSIDIEAFKKMSLADQRMEIAKAPPERKAELKKIQCHQMLLVEWGGEAGLRWIREALVCRARGLIILETIFNTELHLWEQYYSDTDMAYRHAGQLTEDAISILRKMDGERQTLVRQRDAAHALVFHMAASPAALELVKSVEILRKELDEKYGLIGTPATESIDKEKMRELEKRMDQIFTKMKTLPTLPQEEIQKEYDAVPEEKAPH